MNKNVKAACIVVLAACGPAAAQQPPQHLLRLAFEAGKSHYMRQTMSMRMAQGDGFLQMAMNTAMTIETRVESFEGGKAVVAQTVRRLVVVIGGPPRVTYDSDDPAAKPGLMKGMADLVGKTIRMAIDERGRISSVRVPDDFDAERAFGAFGVMGGLDAKELFGRGLPEFPDQPVAIGGTWTSEFEMPLGKLGTFKIKLVNKLLAVEKGKAVFSQTQEIDGDSIALPGGGKLTMALDQAESTSVISLATGRQLEVSADNVSTTTTAGAGATTMTMSVRMQAIDPPGAVPKQPEPVLPASTQGKTVVLEDIVLAILHDPECADFTAGRECAAADHWRAAFTSFDGAPLMTLPAGKVDGSVLARVLAQTAALRRRLPDGLQVAEAQVVIRADRRTPYAVVQQLLQQAAAAGIWRIAFAVQGPGPRNSGRVLATPFPSSDAEMRDEADRNITVSLLRDAGGAVARQFGRNLLPAGAEGDRDSVDMLKGAFEGWSRLGMSSVPGIIDSQGAVPWQDVVRLIDDLRAIGIENVRFGRSAAPK